MGTIAPKTGPNLLGQIFGLGLGRGQTFRDESVDDLVDRLSGDVAVLGEGQRGLEAFLLSDGVAVDHELLDEAEELENDKK